MTLIDDDEDLIGDVREEVEHVTFKTADVHTVIQGVSIAWLMKAFRMGRAAIEAKLAGCPAVGTGKHNIPLYDLPVAASYLIKPRMSQAEMFKTLRPNDLPDKLKDAYWAAKLKQQKYERQAGELWRTEDVLDTFAEVFKILRQSLQLIPDAVDREKGISPEQRQIITRAVDAIQDELHQKLVLFAQERATPSSVAGLDDEDEEDEE
jgi:hypothetical protein